MKEYPEQEKVFSGKRRFVRGFCGTSSKRFVANRIKKGWHSSLFKTRWITCGCTLVDNFLNCIICCALAIIRPSLRLKGEDENCFHLGSICVLPPQVLMYMDCLHGKWPLDAIKAVFSRRFLLQNCAVEVYTSAGSKFTLALSLRS